MNSKRLSKHYLPLTGLIIIAIFLFYIFRGNRNGMAFVAYSTGFISLVILSFSLILGPMNIILKYNNPVTSYLRRDISIIGGILAIVHSVTGLFVHLRGRMWLYFLNEDHSVRFDHFGLANYTGVFSALIIILLLITSNDYSFRILKSARWKNIQRLSYLMFIIILVHCYFYRIGNSDLTVFYWFYLPLTVTILILQITGMFIRSRMR
jgi:methionine sulfoxide reductase heme-binding subunit